MLVTSIKSMLIWTSPSEDSIYYQHLQKKFQDNIINIATFSINTIDHKWLDIDEFDICIITSKYAIQKKDIQIWKKIEFSNKVIIAIGGTTKKRLASYISDDAILVNKSSYSSQGIIELLESKYSYMDLVKKRVLIVTGKNPNNFLPNFLSDNKIRYKIQCVYERVKIDINRKYIQQLDIFDTIYLFISSSMSFEIVDLIAKKVELKELIIIVLSDSTRDILQKSHPKIQIEVVKNINDLNSLIKHF